MCLGGFPHHIYNMAQSKSFFGLRKGSTKSLTFSVYNGKQVTKDRVTVVKNPRTSMQMKQRAIMATAIRVYSAMKEICDHSNEALSYGQKTMNWFIRKNANLLRKNAPAISLSVKDGFAVPNAYIISEGSLTCPAFRYTGDSFQIEQEMQTLSIKKLSDLWAFFGAPNVGDMVTLLILEQSTALGNSAFYWVRFKHLNGDDAKEITISQSNASVFSLMTAEHYETNIDNFEPADINFQVNWASGILLFTLVADGSVGLITSRKSDTGWLRSTSYMTMGATPNYDAALATFPTGGEKILNGGNV